MRIIRENKIKKKKQKSSNLKFYYDKKLVSNSSDFFHINYINRLFLFYSWILI